MRSPRESLGLEGQNKFAVKRRSHANHSYNRRKALDNTSTESLNSDEKSRVHKAKSTQNKYKQMLNNTI